MDYTNLLIRMAKRKITRAHLCKLTGYSKASFSRWITKGERMPGEVIYQISQQLDMSPDEICEELLGINLDKPKPTVDRLALAIASAIREI